MPATRLWTLCVGATVALTASAGTCSAQNSKAEAAKSGRAKAADDADTTPKADTAKGERPPGPWDNPALQLRGLKMMVAGGGGGRGGPGGGRGGPGGMTTLLMQSPALQEEIALSEDQKVQLKELNDKADKTRRELFSQMGGRGGQNGGQGGQRGQIDREAIGQAMTQIGQEMTAGISKILEKPQKDRLNEIELRIIGVTSVVRPDIAKRLNLSPIQITQIEAIIEQMNMAQGELMSSGMQQARGMFGGRGGQGGPGGAAGGPGGAGGGPGGPGNRQPTARGEAANGDTAKADAGRGGRRGGEENGDRPQRPDFNSPEMQERMTAMGEAMAKLNLEGEKIEKQATTSIAKILTKVQKTKFNAMLGEDYDLLKLAQRTGGRGGPGGGRGGPGGAAPARGKAAEDDN